MASISSLVKCLWVRPGAYPRVELKKGASLGQAPALPAKIRLGWKRLPVTNTLSYYGRESFVTLGPEKFKQLNVEKNFFKYFSYIKFIMGPVLKNFY